MLFRKILLVKYLEFFEKKILKIYSKRDLKRIFTKQQFHSTF